MATTTRVKQWGFSDDSHYTLTGDTAIAASVLSLTSPTYTLPFGGAKWSVVPDGGHYDGNGDLVLQNGVVYVAEDGGGSDLAADNGMFVFHAKRGTHADTKKLESYFRYDSAGGAKLIADVVDGTGARIVNADASLAVVDGEWLDDWPEDETWRLFMLLFVGTDVTFQLDDYRAVGTGADRARIGTAIAATSLP